MFCRIDVLTREAKGRRVVVTRYATAASSRRGQSDSRNASAEHTLAAGFRVYDLHTGKTKEIWDLG